MLYGNDPRDEEFLREIKNLERQRLWYPFLIFGFLILYIWAAGGNVFKGPTIETAYPMIIVIGLIYVGTELLNVKILLVKAEYRDWLRDFRSEQWADMNSD